MAQALLELDTLLPVQKRPSRGKQSTGKSAGATRVLAFLVATAQHAELGVGIVMEAR